MRDAETLVVGLVSLSDLAANVRYGWNTDIALRAQVRRLGGMKHPEQRFVIEVTPTDEFICRVARTPEQRISMNDLGAVYVKTKDSGPRGADVCWILGARQAKRRWLFLSRRLADGSLETLPVGLCCPARRTDREQQRAEIIAVSCNELAMLIGLNVEVGSGLFLDFYRKARRRRPIEKFQAKIVDSKLWWRSTGANASTLSDFCNGSNADIPAIAGERERGRLGFMYR